MHVPIWRRLIMGITGRPSYAHYDNQGNIVLSFRKQGMTIAVLTARFGLPLPAVVVDYYNFREHR